jgi:hypothetical protein
MEHYVEHFVRAGCRRPHGSMHAAPIMIDVRHALFFICSYSALAKRDTLYGWILALGGLGDGLGSNGTINIFLSRTPYVADAFDFVLYPRHTVMVNLASPSSS